jgi:hypothetical protein
MTWQGVQTKSQENPSAASIFLGGVQLQGYENAVMLPSLLNANKADQRHQ